MNYPSTLEQFSAGSFSLAPGRPVQLIDKPLSIIGAYSSHQSHSNPKQIMLLRVATFDHKLIPFDREWMCAMVSAVL